MQNVSILRWIGAVQNIKRMADPFTMALMGEGCGLFEAIETGSEHKEGLAAKYCLASIDDPKRLCYNG